MSGNIRKPAWYSAWQFIQSSIHLSSSRLILSHDKAWLPLMPNNLSSPFTWWNASAFGQRLYPQTAHLPPLYAIACAFRSSLRWFTMHELHFCMVCPLCRSYICRRLQTVQTRLWSKSKRLLLCLPYGEQERQYFLLPSTLDLPSIFIRVGKVSPHFLHFMRLLYYIQMQESIVLSPMSYRALWSILYQIGGALGRGKIRNTASVTKQS